MKTLRFNGATIVALLSTLCALLALTMTPALATWVNGFQRDTNGYLYVNNGANTANVKTILSSTAPTSCTSLEVNTKGVLVEVVNANANAQTQQITLFDEGSSPSCNDLDKIWSGTLGGSQVVTLNVPVGAGISYDLSGAIANNLVVVRQ